ncbi:MAG: phosphatase PAP2 family protein [Thermoleophilia bacterium]
MQLAKWRGLREIAIFVAGYLTYFGVRALTQSETAQALSNAWTLIRFETQAGIHVERDVQEAFLASSVLVDAANAVYIYGHWPVLIGAGVLLFRHRPDEYYLLRNAILLTGFVGLVTFALFPVAPPRLTSLPLVDTITREAGSYRQVLPAALVNEYAAMPSFHAGWNVLLGVVVYRAAPHWLLRGMAVAGAAAMVIAVVATANHYVVDVVAGIAIALLGLLVLDLSSRRRTPPRIAQRDVRGCPQGRQRRAAAPASRSAEPAARRG